MFRVRSGSLLSHFQGNTFYNFTSEVTVYKYIYQLPQYCWPILDQSYFTGDSSRTAPMVSCRKRRCWRCTPWSCLRGMPWSLLIRFLGFLIMMEMEALISRWEVYHEHCQAQYNYHRSSCLQQIWLPVDHPRKNCGGHLRCMIRMLQVRQTKY